MATHSKKNSVAAAYSLAISSMLLICVISRRLALAILVSCWDLLEGERNSDNDRQLLTLAFTSRYHWQHVGGPREFAISDWMVARAYATGGHAGPALEWALLAQAATPDDSPSWMKASMLEGIARAHKTAGDIQRMNTYKLLATEELALETNENDASLIRAQIEEL